MAKPLRKSVSFELLGEEVRVDLNFRVIQVLERVYDANLDHVIAFELAIPARVKRSKVAEAIADWLETQGIDRDWKRREVLEHVMGAPVEQLNKYIGCLQAAALFCLRGPDGLPQIDDEGIALLMEGKDLPSKLEKKAEPEAPPDAAPSPTPSPEPVTT